MSHRVALVRTGVRYASVIRVTGISEIGIKLAVTNNLKHAATKYARPKQARGEEKIQGYAHLTSSIFSQRICPGRPNSQFCILP
jgi:hypothetical protein